MPIPSSIVSLFNQLTQELHQIEQDATEGLNIISVLLSRFPNNQSLIGLFAFLNNALFFANIYRKRIQGVMEDISPDETTDKEVEEAGEDLSTFFGAIVEVRLEVQQILARLQDYRL